MLISILLLLLHTRFLPFLDDQSDGLQFVSLSCTMFTLVILLAFSTKLPKEGSMEWQERIVDAFDGCLVVLQLLPLLIALFFNLGSSLFALIWVRGGATTEVVVSPSVSQQRDVQQEGDVLHI